MPVDTSIYGMIRPAQAGPGPMELAGQGLQIRHMLDQGQLSDMQRAQLKISMDEDAAVKAAFSGMQPGQTIGDILPQVMKASPKTGVSMQKSVLEQQKTEADMAKVKSETFAKNMQIVRDLAAQARDDNGMRAVKEMTLRLFGPEQAARIPDKYDPQSQERLVMTADQLIERLKPNNQVVNLGGTSRVVQTNPLAAGATTGDLAHTATPGEVMTDTRTRAEGAANRAVTTRGQDLTDTRQREANAVSAATASLRQRELNDAAATRNYGQEQAMASYDTALATLDRLEKHPGMQAAVGAGVGKTMLPFLGPRPGTDRAGFMKELETFKAQTFLPMVQQLKGMGALSDAEGQKLSAAVGALHEDMPEKEFLASIKLIKKDLGLAKERASRARSTSPATGDKLGGVLTQNPDGSFNYGFSK